MDDDAAYLRRQMDQALIGAQEKHWEKMTEIAARQINIESELTTLAARFVEHIEDERSQLSVLQECTLKLAGHSIKIEFLERMQYALWGALGTLAVGGMGWVIAHVSVPH